MCRCREAGAHVGCPHTSHATGAAIAPQPPATHPPTTTTALQDDLASNEYVQKKAELRYMKIMHMRARGR